MTKSKAPDFHHVARLLRQMEPRFQLMALYAAQFWSDERLEGAERAGDVPGRPSELNPPKASSLQ
jgi:hypothetical protein